MCGTEIRVWGAQPRYRVGLRHCEGLRKAKFQAARLCAPRPQEQRAGFGKTRSDKQPNNTIIRTSVRRDLRRQASAGHACGRQLGMLSQGDTRAGEGNQKLDWEMSL